MRTLIAVTSLTIVAMALPIAAMAQKADRILDDPIVPTMVRTIPIGPDEPIMPFKGRWEPAGLLLGAKPVEQPPVAQNAPAVRPRALVSLPRAKKLGEDDRPAQVLCIKNHMRTVWHGRSWNCRK